MMTAFPLNQANLERLFKVSEVFLGVDLHAEIGLNMQKYATFKLRPSAQPVFLRKRKKNVLNPNPLYISSRHDAEQKNCDRFKLVEIQISSFALCSSRMFKENRNNAGGHL